MSTILIRHPSILALIHDYSSMHALGMDMLAYSRDLLCVPDSAHRWAVMS